MFYKSSLAHRLSCCNPKSNYLKGLQIAAELEHLDNIHPEQTWWNYDWLPTFLLFCFQFIMSSWPVFISDVGRYFLIHLYFWGNPYFMPKLETAAASVPSRFFTLKAFMFYKLSYHLSLVSAVSYFHFKHICGFFHYSSLHMVINFWVCQKHRV